jgi:hypothetical protein
MIRPDLYRDLVQSIFSYDWKCDKKVTIAFVNLLGHIVSSNATFLVPVFRMLIKNLVPTALISTLEATDPIQQKLLEERQQRIHHTLQGIIALVPTGQSELFPGKDISNTVVLLPTNFSFRLYLTLFSI